MALTEEERVRILGDDRETAQERIRELETANAKYENMLSGLLIHGQPKGELEERIAKAREILQTILSLGDWEDVKRALDALEGK